MKKYKVIKSFPNPNREFKVGEVITESGFKGTCDIAKDWPEYFEEIKSEYPKVLRIKEKAPCDNYTHPVMDNSIVNVPYSNWPKSLEKCLEKGFCDIHQVQTSPTDIWTIGDRFTFNGLGGSDWKNKFDLIKGFTNRLNGELAVEYSNGIVAVDKIEKVKSPILTTFDNKEMHLGDTIWSLNIDTWQYSIFIVVPSYQVYIPKEATKLFASKEKMLEYIEENKPKFSKKQIEDALKNSTLRFIIQDTYLKDFKQKLGI